VLKHARQLEGAAATPIHDEHDWWQHFLLASLVKIGVVEHERQLS
jgi:hypothetical protein